MKNVLKFHPVLFAIMPVLALFAENIDQLAIPQITRSLIVSGLTSIFMLFILWRILKDVEWAALLTSLFLILFFNYGHVYASLLFQINRLRQNHGLSLDFNQLLLGAHVALVVIWITVAAASLTLFKRSVKWRPQMTHFFFLLGIGSIILPSITIVKNWEALFPQSVDTKVTDSENISVLDTSQKPDIYYLIFDGYGREDVIEEFFDYDNSSFTSYLEDLGFYIASASRSNYTITYLSLASSLNMDYLDQIMEFPSTDPLCTHTAGRLLSSGQVMDILRDEGYQIGAIASNFEFTEVRNADFYIYPKGKQLNGFEAMLLHNSFLAFVYDISVLTSGPLEYPGHQIHRDHIHFTFEELAMMPQTPGPKFVFAHIISPHPPFVFGPNGEEIKQRLPFGVWDGDTFPGTREEYREGYKNQLSYINHKIKELVETLLQESETNPIIILQADHGPKSSMEGKTKTPEILRESVAILNGYYFPGQDYSALYPSITPVNTFRVILNQFFNKNFVLLSDLTYFSFEACNGGIDLIPYAGD